MLYLPCGSLAVRRRAVGDPTISQPCASDSTPICLASSARACQTSGRSPTYAWATQRAVAADLDSGWQPT